MGDPWEMSVDGWKGYMRGFGEGMDFPSRRVTAELLKELGAESVLDVGCGGGIEYESLKAKGVAVRYSGVDYTPNAIQACKELFPEIEDRFRVMDARALDFVQDAFDVVIVRHCLEHVDDWRKVISEAHRVARKAVIIVLWVEPVFAETEVQEKGRDTFYVKFKKQDLMDEFDKYNPALQEIQVKGDVPGREHRIDTIFMFKKL